MFEADHWDAIRGEDVGEWLDEHDEEFLADGETIEDEVETLFDDEYDINSDEYEVFEDEGYADEAYDEEALEEKALAEEALELDVLDEEAVEEEAFEEDEFADNDVYDDLVDEDLEDLTWEDESHEPELWQDESSGFVTFPSGIQLPIVSGAEGPSEAYCDPSQSGNSLLNTAGPYAALELSNNFTVHELASSGGRLAAPARIDPKLVNALQALRDHVGKPIRVISGYRSWKRNVQVYANRAVAKYEKDKLNGRKTSKNFKVTQSQHCSGRAADISIPGMTGLEIAKAFIDVAGCNVGVGIGANKAHVDVRGRQAYWTYFSGTKDVRLKRAIKIHFDRCKVHGPQAKRENPEQAVLPTPDVGGVATPFGGVAASVGRAAIAGFAVGAAIAKSPPTVGFEFDIHYGFLKELIVPSGFTFPGNGAVVTSHSRAVEGFRVKRDGPRMEIATTPFTVNKAGRKNLKETIRHIAVFGQQLRKGCSTAGRAPSIKDGQKALKGKPRPFPLPRALVSGLPVARLPVRGRFHPKNCSVWSSPQATLTIPLENVPVLIRVIKRSERRGVGRALTGHAGKHRMGLRSEALYQALRAVNRSRRSVIKSRIRLDDGSIVTREMYTPKLRGFLILLASYLISGELRYRYGVRGGDYEQFAKAYLPINVKAPFSEIYRTLLTDAEKKIFEQVYAQGPARQRLFALAKPRATLVDGNKHLFPSGPDVNGEPAVYQFQKDEFGFVPSWDDLVEHTLNSNHRSMGDKLLVTHSTPIPVSKTVTALRWNCAE